MLDAVPAELLGSVFCDSLEIYGSDWTPGLPDEFARDFKAPEPTLPKSVGHHREWLNAIRGHGKPLCEFGYAGRLAEAVLLGNVSYRCGQEIAWDAAAGKVTNTPAAEQYIRCETRKGWELPG